MPDTAPHPTIRSASGADDRGQVEPNAANGPASRPIAAQPAPATSTGCQPDEPDPASAAIAPAADVAAQTVRAHARDLRCARVTMRVIPPTVPSTVPAKVPSGAANSAVNGSNQTSATTTAVTAPAMAPQPRARTTIWPSTSVAGRG